jgi:hypothetical protein
MRIPSQGRPTGKGPFPWQCRSCGRLSGRCFPQLRPIRLERVLLYSGDSQFIHLAHYRKNTKANRPPAAQCPASHNSGRRRLQAVITRKKQPKDAQKRLFSPVFTLIRVILGNPSSSFRTLSTTDSQPGVASSVGDEVFHNPPRQPLAPKPHPPGQPLAIERHHPSQPLANPGPPLIPVPCSLFPVP